MKPTTRHQVLDLTLASGDVVKDFAQVRIYDPKGGTQRAFLGWIHHTPVRGIVPGTNVRLQVRPWADILATSVDFGDHTPARPSTPEMTHIYAKPGLYTVTLTGTANALPAVLKTSVVVDPR